MNDIAQIAAALAAFIAPFTPALLEAGKTAGQQWAEMLGAKGGEATWNKAQALWEKIHARFGDDPKVKGATLLVSADPEDSAAQTLLATALGKQLQADPQFSQELFQLMGGEQAIQEVLADRGSWVEEVAQEMQGTGRQTIQASENSVIKNVRQAKN
jgi:hypothetical protein